MTKRNYSNVARPIALTATMTAGATVAQVASTAGYPEAPFLLAAERGTDNEEVMLCTVKNPNNFEVTRGFDGTTPKQHQAGQPVEHVTAAIDFEEAGAHVWNVALHSPFLPGMVMQYAAAAAPGGWLLCQGQVVAQSDYPALFGVIGSTYNTGSEGAGNFRLPDYRGKVAVGRDTADTSFDTLAKTGGAKTVTLTAAQMPTHAHPLPAHNHGVNDPGHGHAVNDPSHDHGTVPHGHGVAGDSPAASRILITYSGSSIRFSGTGQEITYSQLDTTTVDVVPATTGIWLSNSGTGISTQNATPVVGNTGSGAAHENMPPFSVTNFIIKT